MDVIGDLCQMPGEMTMEWKIKDFLSQEINKSYCSSKFYFSGASWQMRLFPNGHPSCQSDGWIGIYLERMSSGFPLTLSYSFKLKLGVVKLCPKIQGKRTFRSRSCTWGKPKVIERSVLMNKAEKTSTKVLTIICYLMNSVRSNIAGSLFKRYQDLSDNLKEIYKKANRSDLVMNVDNNWFFTHRMILETRSPVFAAMFSHDTLENKTGEITITDSDKIAMDVILEFMYTGDVETLKESNIFSVYSAADKYDLQDLKDICSEFIAMKLSIEWICEVIKFTELHQDEIVNRAVNEFFKENACEILETESWKTFAEENHAKSIELLSSVVISVVPRKKKRSD